MSNQESRTILSRLHDKLLSEGWSITSVTDEEVNTEETPTFGAVRDMVFDLDISWLTVTNKHGNSHSILFIPENGRDAVSDWSYTFSDPDGFNSVMDSFLDDLFAEEDAQ